MQIRSRFLSILPLLSRNSPKLMKICRNALLLSISAYWIAPYIFKPISCSSIFGLFPINIQLIKDNTITIKKDGEIVGSAYCFAEGLLVTAIHQNPWKQLTNNGKGQLQYFMKGKKLKGTFKIIGNFENLTFIQFFQNDEINFFLPSFSADTSSEVEILEHKQFLSIKKAYLVDSDVGFKIVDGHGSVGNLITKNGLPLGIVTHIGVQKQRGFLRVINWLDLQNIAKRMKRELPYLGISASPIQGRDGISIVRVSSNSPLKDKINLGDVITQVNNQKIRTPQDLIRMIMLSQKGVKIRVQYENIVRQIDLAI